jgi:hypothetical protein
VELTEDPPPFANMLALLPVSEFGLLAVFNAEPDVRLVVPLLGFVGTGATRVDLAKAVAGCVVVSANSAGADEDDSVQANVVVDGAAVFTAGADPWNLEEDETPRQLVSNDGADIDDDDSRTGSDGRVSDARMEFLDCFFPK